MQLIELMLGEIGLVHMDAVFDKAAVLLHHSGDHLEQGRLAGAVGTHQRDLVPPVDIQIQILVDLLLAEGLAQALDAHHQITRALGLAEIELDGLLLLGQHDALDLLQLADSVLHLLCLGGLIAEALDEGLHVRDFRLLLGSLVAQQGKPFLALLQIRAVIALVQVDLAVVHFGHTVDHGIHEGAVMADYDDGAGIAAQKALEPLNAFQVQMVGGLVQHEHVGVADQKLRERDAHLPATGKVIGAAAHVVFTEAQAEKHAAHLRLQGVAAQGFVHVAGLTRRIKLGCSGIITQFGFEPAQALLRFQDLDLAGDDLFEDGPILHFDGFLLQVAHVGSLRKQDTAFVGVVFAGNDIQKRGLAGTVGTHKRKAVIGFKAQVHVVEQGPGAI